VAEEQGRERPGVVEGERGRREAMVGEERARSLELVYSLCPSLDTRKRSLSWAAQAWRVEARMARCSGAPCCR